MDQEAGQKKNKGRNILLIIDNCMVHAPEINISKTVKILFLSLNVTSVLQPMDQSAVQCFKKM